MLMRCEGCGRMFDYNKADGVCPGCGRFCARPGPDGPDAGAADGWAEPGSAEAAFAADGWPQPGPAAQNSPRAAAWPVLFCLLAALWLGSMAGGFLLLRHRQAALPGRAAFVSPVADEVSGAFRCRGREITITGAEIMGGEYRAGLPENGCLVRVGLRLDETAWQDNADLFYLQSGGCFYQAADVYALEQVYPALARAALDDYQLQAPEAAEGWLYFALPAPPEAAALYLEQAVGYGEDRRVTGAAYAKLSFAPAGAEGGGQDA